MKKNRKGAMLPDFDESMDETQNCMPVMPRKRTPSIPKDLTLLGALKWLYESVEDTGMSKAYMKKAQPVTSFVSEKLGINERQAVLASILVAECSTSNCLTPRDIIQHIGCTPFDVIGYVKELDGLVEARLAERCSGPMSNDNTFKTRPALTLAIQENQTYSAPTFQDLDVDGLFTEIGCIFDDLENDDTPFCCQTATKRIVSLLEKNPQLPASKRILAINFASPVEFIAFVFMCCIHLNCDISEIVMNQTNLSCLIGRRDFEKFMRRLKNGKCRLLETKCIEQVSESGMAGDTYCVESSLRSEILEREIGNNMSCSMLQPQDITEHKLFFAPDDQHQMDRMRKILSQDKLDKVFGKLKDAGMRQGICICLSGGPGTGKTESVLQIARETGRPVIRFDVSAVRDKFVGESEKRCARIFDSYRDIVRQSKVTPILFLNECDQLLSKRIDNVSSSVDQMSNSVQNIILEKMEQMEGILICTTNLVSNLDPAFERRFLIKQELAKPTAQVRSKIWMSKIGGLTESDAMALSDEFDLSGGQIENVARRLVIDNALDCDDDNATPLLDRCRDFCQREKFGPLKSASRLGF